MLFDEFKKKLTLSWMDDNIDYKMTLTCHESGLVCKEDHPQSHIYMCLKETLI